MLSLNKSDKRGWICECFWKLLLLWWAAFRWTTDINACDCLQSATTEDLLQKLWWLWWEKERKKKRHYWTTAISPPQFLTANKIFIEWCLICWNAHMDLGPSTDDPCATLFYSRTKKIAFYLVDDILLLTSCSTVQHWLCHHPRIYIHKLPRTNAEQ